MAARIAYQAMLDRWPGSFSARIGLGNAAYALGDFSVAEEAFQTATQIRPNSALALNNLAHVLAKLGKYDQAIQAAERAILLSDKYVKTSEETLTEIRNQIDQLKKNVLEQN